MTVTKAEARALADELEKWNDEGARGGRHTARLLRDLADERDDLKEMRVRDEYDFSHVVAQRDHYEQAIREALTVSTQLATRDTTARLGAMFRILRAALPAETEETT